VANSRVVLEAARWMKASEKLEKEDKERVKRNAEDITLKTALEEFGKWFGDGAKVDESGFPT
jgi:hypothetical protein